MCKYRQIEIVFIEMLSVIVSCFEKFSLLLVAADDLVEQCPAAVPESICQFVVHPKTMHIEKGVLTSGRGKGKNVFEAVQKIRSTCFSGSKTTRLRLVVLNPIKHSCSFLNIT